MTGQKEKKRCKVCGRKVRGNGWMNQEGRSYCWEHKGQRESKFQYMSDEELTAGLAEFGISID